MKIEDVKKGAYFKKTATAKKVFIRGDFNRSLKKYEGQNFDDISDFCHIKKGVKVFTDFDF